MSLDNALQHPGCNQLRTDLVFVEQRQFIRMRLGEYNLPEYHARQYAIAGLVKSRRRIFYPLCLAC